MTILARSRSITFGIVLISCLVGCGSDQQIAPGVVAIDGIRYRFPARLQFDNRIWHRTSRWVCDGKTLVYFYESDEQVMERVEVRVDVAKGANRPLTTYVVKTIVLAKRERPDSVLWHDNGPSVSYMSDGSKVESTFNMGVDSGFTRIYYSNGSVKIEGSFENGVKEGRFNGYYESGELKWTAVYIDGKIDAGTAVVWDEDGRVSNVDPAVIIP